MDSIFCRSCGTLIAENEEFCPTCGRVMDWHDRKQLDCYVHPKMQASKTVKKQNVFPDSIFLEENSKATSVKQETQTIALSNDLQDVHYEKDWIIRMPSTINEEKNESADLTFGEMDLLIVCGLVPVLGTIILAIASFVGDKQQNINRQTAAKALLLTQLVIILTIVVFFAFFFQYVLLLMPYQQFPLDW